MDTALKTTYHVLIVDDAPENIQLISNILYQCGVNLFIAQSGAEALTIIERQPPDLILLDILMPEMDGFAVCEKLKQNPATIAIPIIFLTAKTDQDDVIKGFELGAVDYITKPFNPEEVAVRVFTHLELKKARDLIAAQNQQLAEQNKQLQAFHALKEQQREQQYRLLVEHVADGIGIIQEQRWVFVNDALAAMLGETPEHLLGQPPAAYFHPDNQTQFRQMYTRLEQGLADWQGWPAMQCIVTRERREIWMEGYYSIITWDGRPALLLDMRDITERKLREMAITEERDALRQEMITLRTTITERYRLEEMIGKSRAMQNVYELIVKTVKSEQNVLICGESGTGKELVARTIHQLSPRRGNAFIPVNCGAIPETLFEREFFGHRKGAFTGADRDKQGLLAAAHRGTLFLDEVGEMSDGMQVKLLRALESGEYTPIGETSPQTVDVRIIAATHQNLTEQVEKGLMREDFFYRIHIIVITLPPLRERREDIPLLIDHFVRQSGEQKGLSAIPGEILETLYNYSYPGNIRQLHNILYRYLTMGHLELTGPRSAALSSQEDAAPPDRCPENLRFHDAVAELEKRLILNALEQHHWRRTDAAEALGIPRKTLFRKMKAYGLE